MKRLRRGGFLNRDLSMKIYDFWEESRSSR